MGSGRAGVGSRVRAGSRGALSYNVMLCYVMLCYFLGVFSGGYEGERRAICGFAECMHLSGVEKFHRWRNAVSRAGAVVGVHQCVLLIRT